VKIAIVTDAWRPQVNGVVTSLSRTGDALGQLGHSIRFFTPKPFHTVPCPTYPSIRLAILPGKKLSAMLDEYAPDAIHIATEGPLGLAARRYCRKRGRCFTTSFHTRFPEYIRLRAPIPLRWSYAYMRWFHAAAVRTMVPTESQRTELEARGMKQLVIWPKGVDTELFKPRDKNYLPGDRPLAMFMGRVAIEKNIQAFLELELPGCKYVVGTGPDLEMLKAKYPRVHFTGQKLGEQLAKHLAAADVFVFPSLTDTYGLVMLEAMACGVPVAAYPVTGPVDVVQHGVTGVLDEDLGKATLAALALDGDRCRDYALQHSWLDATREFAGFLAINSNQTGQCGTRPAS
jgi:glycosyltransferase involved in cell wall biosynthesis